MSEIKVVTSKIDMGGYVIYQAWSDDLGADASPIGDGPTEQDAIDDLMWMLAEMEKAE